MTFLNRDDKIGRFDSFRPSPLKTRFKQVGPCVAHLG